MAKYLVEVSLSCTYEVEADTAQEANERAWDWFSECEPDFETTRICCPTCSSLDAETRHCFSAEKCGAENDFRLWTGVFF